MRVQVAVAVAVAGAGGCRVGEQSQRVGWIVVQKKQGAVTSTPGRGQRDSGA